MADICWKVYATYSMLEYENAYVKMVDILTQAVILMFVMSYIDVGEAISILATCVGEGSLELEP